MWLYVASILVSFCGSYIKGFQQQNVTGKHYKAMVVFGFAIAAFDVLAITIIIKGGLWVILTSGLGASCGIVLATWSHGRIIKR